MNFHIYVEDDLQRDLAAYCKATGKKRNAVVREALRKYVRPKKRTRAERQREWKEFIRNFPSNPDFPSVEELRAGLLPPREDIF